VTIALDTSVVVRLLIGAPATQFRAARRRLERAHAEGERVVVADLVLAEAWYALRNHYQVPESALRPVMLEFLRSGLVDTDPAAGERALVETGSAGVVDRLVCIRSLDLRATLLTFDRQQGKLEGAELLR
jgi:predicted nucleic acid-binding protein